MRTRALVTTFVLVGAVLAPALAPRGWDDYPLSSYPMFSRGDLGGRVDLDRVRLFFDDGTDAPAPPVALGTPEPMVAMKVVAGAVARGGGEERALCARVLAAARGAGGETRARVREARVETATFDTTRYFEDRTPLHVEVHARCGVEGP